MVAAAAVSAVVVATVVAVVTTIIAAVIAPIVTAIVAVITAVVAPLFTAFVTDFVTMLVAEITAVVVAMAVVALPVSRCVFTLIPVVADEIDAFAAGVVAVAVLVPVLGMAGWDAQVERRAAVGDGLDHDRFRIEQDWRGVAADVEAAVEAGLADADRDADVGGLGGAAEGGGGHG